MQRSFLLSLPILLACAVTIAAQGSSLQTGVSIEKTLSDKQMHSYVVAVEKDQFIQLTVEQRNVDIVVRVFLPDGTMLAEFDSPTGSEGVEYVEFVAESSGKYRVELSQLPDTEGTGQYGIKVEEVRTATDQEAHNFKNLRTRKTKGFALLNDALQYVDQLRLAETRVAMRIKAAQLLWEADPKQASTLIGRAVADVRDVIAQEALRDDVDFESYQRAMELRHRLIRALAPHDPEAALKFFQSTRIPPEFSVGQPNADLQLEFQLVNLAAEKNPKLAFDLAQDLLKRTSSAMLIETLNRLASKDRELAGRLARDMAAKATQQDLMKSREAAYLASSLLNVVRYSQAATINKGTDTPVSRLLSNDEYRELFLKIIAEIMSYSPPSATLYSPELDAARNLAGVIRQMPADLKTYAPDRAAAVDVKIAELIGTVAPPAQDWQKYQTAVNSASVDAALEAVPEAPQHMRDFLYQHVATRVANSGDVARAKQIISERITDPTQRQSALMTLQQQAVTSAAEKERFDEALRLLSGFRPGPERDNLVIQTLDQIGRGVKKQLAMQYLSQGKNLIGPAGRARNSQQMYSLLALSRTFARHDINQAFEIVAPLLDQFNEISAAAVTMNGFNHDYYRDGELIRGDDNPISNTADQFSETFASLAMFDFERAKTAADGINRLDVRLRVFLLMAERTMGLQLEPDEPTGYNSCD